MKLLAITLLPLVLGVTASEGPTLVKKSTPDLTSRDLATVTSVIASVDTNIKGLTTVVTSFSGDLASLQSSAQTLLSSIQQGTTQISASAALSLTDAVGLQSVVTSLQTDGQALVDALTAKKTAFQQAGLCQVILSQATELSTASKTLITAVVGKVPQEAQSIAQNLANGVIDTLAKAQSAFAAGSCVNSGGGGGGGATATATATRTGGGGGGASATVSPSVPGGGGGGTRPTSTLSGGGGGQGQCMCPCACTASVPPATTRTTVGSVLTPRPTGQPAQNTTTGRPPVVTAGAATAGSLGAGLFAGVLIGLLL